MTWLRLEAAITHDAKMIRAGFWGGVAFIAALTYAKLHQHRGGKIPEEDFTPEVIARHMNATNQAQVKALDRGLKAAIKEKLLLRENGYLKIKGWAKYQSDPTHADRQARYRQRRSGGRDVTNQPRNQGSDVTDRNVTEVTATGREKRREENPPPEPPPCGVGTEVDGSPEWRRAVVLEACSRILARRKDGPLTENARTVQRDAKAGELSRKWIELVHDQIERTEPRVLRQSERALERSKAKAERWLGEVEG